MPGESICQRASDGRRGISIGVKYPRVI